MTKKLNARSSHVFRRLRVGPVETFLLAENAPRCMVVAHNHGPGVLELTCANVKRATIVPPGRLIVEAFYGKIGIAVGDVAAVVDLDFLPQPKI